MKKLLQIIILISLFTSCQTIKPITLVPGKDPAMAPAIVHLNQMTDSLFTSVETSQNKSFAEYEPRYAIVKATIDSIYVVDIVRLKSNNIVSIVGKTRDLFVGFTNSHKQRIVLNESLAKIYRLQMDAAYSALLTAEKALK